MKYEVDTRDIIGGSRPRGQSTRKWCTRCGVDLPKTRFGPAGKVNPKCTVKDPYMCQDCNGLPEVT